MMAAADHIEIAIEGKGGHAARPHLAIDTVLVGAQIINSAAVDRVAQCRSAEIGGGLDLHVPGRQCRQRHSAARAAERHGAQLDAGGARPVGAAYRRSRRRHGAALRRDAEVSFRRGYPVLVNHERETSFAADVAREIVGDYQWLPTCAPVMGAEDFAYMLEERPGAFIFVGNGDSAAFITRRTTSTTR